MDAAQYRSLRGLAIHFREAWPRIRQWRQYSRGLLAPFGQEKGHTGRCCWCRLQLKESYRKWHRECYQAYLIATGQPVLHLWPIWKRPPCPCGEPAWELDHRDALILAWTTGDPRRIMRAWTLNNLAWLCHECHKAKTTADMQALWTLRREQVCLIGLGYSPRNTGLGKECWLSVEGGIARNIRAEDGRMTASKPAGYRGPVTFRPENATCPRCLVAMENTSGDGRGFGAGARPAYWHMDAYRARIERIMPIRTKGRTKLPAAADQNQMTLALEF